MRTRGDYEGWDASGKHQVAQLTELSVILNSGMLESISEKMVEMIEKRTPFQGR